MSDHLKKREEEISSLLMEQPVNLKELRKLSRAEGGFLTNQLRARVWPKLLGVNRFDIPDYRSFIDPHRDDSQVKVDVERSLWKIDKTVNWRDTFREDRRKALCDIMMAILCRNADLYYYQGFHDVVSVFLLVLEDDHIAFALAEVICRDYISDFMNCDFEVVGKSMKMLFVIIKASDSVLHRFLMSADMEPFFATSWLLTWFAHDLQYISDAARLFDAILCSHPLFIYYLCAAYVIHLRKEILAAECDFSGIHDVLVRAPSVHGFPTDKIIALADSLFARTPPDVLKKLCDPELQKLIYYNQIAAICKPHVYVDFIDSDWTILKGMRVRHLGGQSFYLERQFASVMTFIGWNSAAHELIDATVHAAHCDSTLGKLGKPTNSDTSQSTASKEDKVALQAALQDEKKSVHRNNIKDPTSIKGRKPTKSKGNKTDAMKRGLYYMTTLSGQGMVVMALVIGLVSYSIKIFYSR